MFLFVFYVFQVSDGSGNGERGWHCFQAIFMDTYVIATIYCTVILVTQASSQAHTKDVSFIRRFYDATPPGLRTHARAPWFSATRIFSLLPSSSSGLNVFLVTGSGKVEFKNKIL